MLTESPLRDLDAIIRSRTPLIAMESNEEPQVVHLVREIAKKLQLKAFRWTVTEGLQAFDPKDQPKQSVMESQEILSYIKTSSNNCLFVLLDFHPYLQNALHVRFLKDIALTYSRHYSTVVLVGFALNVPEELRRSPPSFACRCRPRRNCAPSFMMWPVNGARNTAITKCKPPTKPSICSCAISSASRATDARRLALKAINDNGVISESDLPDVMRAKYELLGRDSVLSFE